MLIAAFPRSIVVFLVLAFGASGCSSCGRDSDEIEGTDSTAPRLHESTNDNPVRSNRLVQPPRQPPAGTMGGGYQLTHRHEADGSAL